MDAHLAALFGTKISDFRSSEALGRLLEKMKKTEKYDDDIRDSRKRAFCRVKRRRCVWPNKAFLRLEKGPWVRFARLLGSVNCFLASAVYAAHNGFDPCHPILGFEAESRGATSRTRLREISQQSRKSG